MLCYLFKAHSPSAKYISVAFISVFVLEGSCLEPGNSSNGSNGENDTLFQPLLDQASPDVWGNLEEETESADCKKLNKTDYRDVTKDHLLGKIEYTVDSKRYKMSLVEALAENDAWEAVGEVRDLMNPQVIRAHFQQTREELLESSHRLFKILFEQGYKGRFHWDAYIEGFNEEDNPRLSRVIRNLKEMLDCLGISRTAMGEVTLQRFNIMECGGQSLSLEVEMAEEWRGVAREFGISEQLIFWERNIPEQCASALLKHFYELAFSWQEIIDIVAEARLYKVAAGLERALDHHCVED